ncbi:mitochondrial ribosomal protein L17-2 precursor, putative [Plasmodium reichenowi]|uniref:Mitochondrial ribosomal protein L17-2, putative n=13 Tax=Plasmodium (Laverania) TaxID=418107 RepID=Q8ILF5_PLAF7|nr:mitochondrial ribosomal protein L17-2 precursor, putative [Plasmodium falciparum 3D7]XP_012765357.1 mitochondrial ribosomal protein L17-2 precursor, putative [Plasmodium reichenowi]ETW16098.1 ribosomal protein L17 [Plasmodium falciparum Vietnam Oak-Knoll (FVO)]ETW28753.1 ribosomal protein L17 [Plasmodium falciparum FCH/4]ETW39972.1 ribosomal protein L17 [Plasmodium falciparum NF135/5.C10]ETW53951.1 ribosomal protein L17 [Plasmodium falciparum Palo Alto/Uganda]ETW58257.1 ribosomal protein L|eukprot:XP_001348463.1 mitochondrial ribosomal protein L17-2 precursor,putative [Plasmodium falciparum 3D7]
MGYTSTLKFVNLGVRRRLFRRAHKQPHHKWDSIKNQLNELLKYGRIETTLTKAKELQGYAEELIYLAKKDNVENNLKVESMLRTAQGRRRLYEFYVPLYRHRPFFFTRIINQWKLRLRDSAPLAYIEFIDRPGELRPAKPVGYNKIKFIYEEMKKNRRNFRKYFNIAKRFHLLDENDHLLPDFADTGHVPEKSWYDEENEEDDDEIIINPELIQKYKKFNNPMLKGPKKGREPFYVDLPLPSVTERTFLNYRKKFKP